MRDKPLPSFEIVVQHSVLDEDAIPDHNIDAAIIMLQHLHMPATASLIDRMRVRMRELEDERSKAS